MFGALVVKNIKVVLSIATAAGALAGIMTAQQVSAADPDSAPTTKYHFELTKGKGTPVCDAYLKRLNTADYTTPPYCNRPEETKVPGFTPLRRVPLTAEEIAVIQPRISNFRITGQQGSKEDDAAGRARQIQLGITPLDPLRAAEKLLQGGQKIWRYDPTVDIDNDGVPDNIVVWEAVQCGHAEQTSHYETDGRKPTLAYILAAGNDRLDISKTKAIFGHPSGGYRRPDGTTAPWFRPIGPTIGIFKYADFYYFDSFLYDGDLAEWGRIDRGDYHPKLANNLGVFFRQHGKTQQVCEYHMTEVE